MNWYIKIISNRSHNDAHHDLFEKTDDSINRILEEFLSRNTGEIQSWNPVSLLRVKTIWRDYAEKGFVRDERGMQTISERTIDNIARLHANTILAGHTSQNPEEYFENMEISEGEQEEYYNWIIQDAYSDHAMDPLFADGVELLQAKTSEQQLKIVDRIFNRVHQRGDLAKFFIEGGTSGLLELYNDEK